MKNKTILCIFIILTLLSFFGCKGNVKSIQENHLFINKQKGLLIGKWQNSNKHMRDTPIFEFYENGIWRQTYFSDGKTKISKGKYTLGAENEVYLRYLGSQHWNSNKDTINDYKTSIGSGLLFLYDSLLVNNQEDYEIVYRKIQ